MVEQGTFLVPSQLFPARFSEIMGGGGLGFTAAMAEDIERALAILPVANEAGVKLLCGDDYGAMGLPHGRYADELEFYVKEAGIAPLDVLRWATRHGAEVMDALEDMGLTFSAIEQRSAVRAGEMQRKYLQRARAAGVAVASPRTMPDFLVGAHALLQCNGLITRDEGFFRDIEGRPNFFITGRIKEIIIRDGDKWSPLAIERQLLAGLPELEGRLVALGFPHQLHGEEIGVYLEMDEVDPALRARIEAAVAWMPIESRPKVILFGAAPIPRTHTGKIQRRKLHPLFAGFAQSRGALRIEPAPSPKPAVA